MRSDHLLLSACNVYNLTLSDDVMMYANLCTSWKLVFGFAPPSTSTPSTINTQTTDHRHTDHDGQAVRGGSGSSKECINLTRNWCKDKCIEPTKRHSFNNEITVFQLCIHRMHCQHDDDGHVGIGIPIAAVGVVAVGGASFSPSIFDTAYYSLKT